MIGLVEEPGPDAISLVEEPLVADGPRSRTSSATTRRSPSSSAIWHGRIGLASSRGFGPARGALRSTVAHDAHNLVVVGMTTGHALR